MIAVTRRGLGRAFHSRPAYGVQGQALARGRNSRQGHSLALFLALGLLVRLPMFGLPAFQSDEQFYLLVGQRMAEGALPYVDIWDRKPIGLFLLYRAVFWAPIDPVIAYQVLGLLFSVATALVIERAARLIAPAEGARLAGIAYLLYQCVFNVELGQSPVFYNLPVALAGLVTVRACLVPRSPYLAARGAAAMLLLGLAMQIKYTAVFEGVAMGLLLLERAARDAVPAVRLAALTLGWIALALAPTLAAFAWYAHAGYGEAFAQANFVSIFARHGNLKEALVRLAKEALALSPFALAILRPPCTYPQRHQGQQPAAIGPLRVWALSAVLGFLVLGTWYDHYLGPVLVPLAILSAPALALARAPGHWPGHWQRRFLLGLGTLGAVAVPAFQLREKGDGAQFEAMTRAIASHLHGRCLYVYDGDSALYRTTQACIPTRFAYPSHLDARNEAKALGVDPLAEIDRLMATHPGVVVMRQDARSSAANVQTSARMGELLARDYTRFAVLPLGTRRYALYRLHRPG